jgi:ubiquinone/menaquinone biosynthesis C-methylase UbiE
LGILKNYLQQTQKPDGLLGSLMISSMNSHHAKLADWGMSHLVNIAPDTIEELGCGGGRNVKVLLRKYPDAKIYALDYSALSVRKTMQTNRRAILAKRCTVIQGSITILPFPSESMDLATAFETIYFWPDLTECFKEVYRTLKPEGIFLICNESDGTDEMGKKCETIIDGMKCYSKQDIETALQQAGFSSIRTFHHQKKPWLTVSAIKGDAQK